MSCYFRHIEDILSEAGIEVSPDNKKKIDEVIHGIVGIAYKDCPTTWKTLKQSISDEYKREEFVRKLHDAIG